MTLDQELDEIIDSLPKIADQRRYWLVRTQGGTLYDTFRENNFVAIEHDDISLSKLAEIRDVTKDDPILTQRLIREEIQKQQTQLYEVGKIPIDNRPGLTASQIYRFVFEIKKGDIVIIPSTNSDLVSFGEIKESYIPNVSADDPRRLGPSYFLRKRVNWKSDIPRIDLDPFLFRLFLAHQAVNEVSHYAGVIERSLNNFFILDEYAH